MFSHKKSIYGPSRPHISGRKSIYWNVSPYISGRKSIYRFTLGVWIYISCVWTYTALFGCLNLYFGWVNLYFGCLNLYRCALGVLTYTLGVWIYTAVHGVSELTLWVSRSLLIKVVPVNKVLPSRGHVWSKAKRQPTVSLLLPKYPIISTRPEGRGPLFKLLFCNYLHR